VNKRVSLRIPGSTSNLGPGFDTLGLALSVYANVTFEMLDSPVSVTPRVVRRGEVAEQLPADESNLIYQTFARSWKGDPKDLKSLQITVASEIPLARGLGSSGTAILSAVWAAQALSGERPSREIILNQATEIEGHPDNLAASLYGGLIACSQNGRKVITNKIAWPEQWGTVVVVPSYQLETKKARAVLPKRYSKEDTIFNLQKLGLLISAVANKDEDALKAALVDRLHEPYRESLVPELVSLRKELRTAPVFGCTLSGAGPSVLIVFNKRYSKPIMAQLQDWIRRNNPDTRLLDLTIDQHGLQEV
jgi:homoserine kinase